MRPASPAFLAAVAAGNSLATRVDLLRSGQAIPAFQDLAVSDGTVTIDRTAQVRGRCSLTIVGDDLIPVRSSDPLNPYGNELRIWRGVQLASGDQLVSLGVFGIQGFEVTDPGRAVRIDGLDRSQRIREAVFHDVYVVGAGQDYATQIVNLIVDGYPGVPTRVDPLTAYLTPQLVFDNLEEGGRLEAAQKMATSIGAEVYPDGDGTIVLRAEPSTQGLPTWTVTDGDGGVIVAGSATASGTRDGIYNAVIATSSNPSADAGIRGFAADTDPNSPTWYGTGSVEGTFGRKEKRYSSPFIANQQQADAAAFGVLQQVKGSARSIKFAIAPNPALEPGDVITVRRQALGIDDDIIIDSVQIGLGAGDGMQISGRSIRQRTTT